jgi:hypothetical protein
MERIRDLEKPATGFVLNYANIFQKLREASSFNRSQYLESSRPGIFWCYDAAHDKLQAGFFLPSSLGRHEFRMVGFSGYS